MKRSGAGGSESGVSNEAREGTTSPTGRGVRAGRDERRASRLGLDGLLEPVEHHAPVAARLLAGLLAGVVVLRQVDVDRPVGPVQLDGHRVIALGAIGRAGERAE